MELDKANRKIIAELKANARMPTAEIGRRIGLSRTAVQDRINKLESQGYIQGYRVITGKSSDTNLKALLSVKFASKPCAPIIERLLKFEGVDEIYSLSGEWDALLRVSCSGADELSMLNDDIANDDSVSETTSQIILSHHSNMIES